MNNPSNLPTIDNLPTLNPPIIPAAWKKQSGGLIIVSGRTNSGKTTTLYNTLNDLPANHRIVTIEDNSEYFVPRPRIAQLNLNHPQGKSSFKEVFDTAIRMRPDSILIGEIRNSEAANSALGGASSGHLMYTSLHANSVKSSLTRLRHLGADSTHLADNLTGILHQALLQRLCPACKTPYKTTTAELEALQLPNDPNNLPTSLYQANGCGNCEMGQGNYHIRGTGYKGYLATYVTVTPNEELRNALRDKADDATVEALTEKNATSTIRQASWGKALQGLTSLQEILHAA